MAYLSLYRKYRSQSFEEVSGQEHVIRTLQNAIRSGRVAHAYLFCGPRGTGKTTTARLLGKALNCEKGPTPEPCNVCEACVQITEGRYLDMKEIDAASNRGIDEIRDLRDNVAYAPANGRYKVYVIDEAHQITGDAFNAFLKTLEEPPPHVVFIMATTEAHKIPATIVSRCQKFEYRRATLEQLRERVAYVAEQEGVQIDDGALTLIAREANGGWRDALSLLEQVLAFCEGTITARDIYAVLGTVDADTLYELGEHIRLADGGAAYTLIDAQIAEGKDPRQLLRDLTAHYRTLMLAAAGVAPTVEPEQVSRIVEQSRGFGQGRLIAGIELLAQIDREARWSEQPRLLLDVALAKLMLPTAPAAPVQAPQPQAAPVQTRQTTPRPEPSRPTSTPSRAPAAASPFVDEDRPPAPARNSPPAAASIGKFGEDFRPPPLTVGDARTGDTGDDDFLSTFDVPGEAAIPAASSAPPSNGVPAASPSVSPAPIASGGASGNIELMRSKWRLIGEELKRDKKRMIETALVDTLPHRFEQDELVVQFPTGTMAEMFTKRGKEFSEPLINAIERVTGVRCRVRAEWSGKAGSGPAPRGSASGSGPQRTPGTGPSGPAAGGRPSPTPANRPTPAPAASEPLPLDAPAAPKQSSLPSMPAPGSSELIHDVLEVFEGRIIDDEERDLN